MARGPVFLKDFSERFDPTGAADPDRALLNWLFWRGLVGIDGIGFISTFGEALVAAGLPVARGSIGIETVHPEFSGQISAWRRADGVVTQEDFRHSDGQQSDFRASPMYHMLANKLTDMRCPKIPLFQTPMPDSVRAWPASLNCVA